MRQFCRFFYCLAWFDTVEFNCLPCPNNEMYDDTVFADRFHCQLTMFGIRVLIGLSGLLQLSAVSKQRDLRLWGFRWSIPLSIDYVWNLSIDRAIATPSSSYCVWNRYCQDHRSILPNFLMIAWFDTLELYRLPCSTTRSTMMRFTLIDSDINWLCLKCLYWLGSLDSLITRLHLK